MISKWKDEKVPKSLSKIKVILTVFFDYRCIVHYKFLLTGQSIKIIIRVFCVVFIKQFIRKNPEMWRKKSWVLHHDNAPFHSLIIIRDV